MLAHSFGNFERINCWYLVTRRRFGSPVNDASALDKRPRRARFGYSLFSTPADTKLKATSIYAAAAGGLGLDTAPYPGGGAWVYGIPWF